MRLEGISMDFRKIWSLLATVTVTGYFVLPQQPAVAAEAMATGLGGFAVRSESTTEEFTCPPLGLEPSLTLLQQQGENRASLDISCSTGRAQ